MAARENGGPFASFVVLNECCGDPNVLKSLYFDCVVLVPAPIFLFIFVNRTQTFISDFFQLAYELGWQS